MADIDNRVIRIGIEVSGSMRFYDQLAITAQGVKFDNGNQGEATVTVTNLEKSERDFLLTETSPYNRNRTPKKISLEIGRQSTGISLLYEGNIIKSTASQPPDQTLSMRCLTGQFMKSRTVGLTVPGAAPLSRIAGQVAQMTGFTLVFEATDRRISNFNFTGSALKLVEKLE